jgi:hypothetical protein
MRTADSLNVTRAIRRRPTAGNFLSGGDFTAVLDMTTLTGQTSPKQFGFPARPPG